MPLLSLWLRAELLHVGMHINETSDDANSDGRFGFGGEIYTECENRKCVVTFTVSKYKSGERRFEGKFLIGTHFPASLRT